jgi:isopentenyldiphosphate isomerase
MDIQYLGTISEDVSFSRQESEVDDIRWFDIEGIESIIIDESVLSMIQKIKSIHYV